MADLGHNAVGMFGKHPAFGDFIGTGLPDPLRKGLEDWLNTTLSRLRDALGEEGWQTTYDNAPLLRFWIGAAVFRTVALRGVLLVSRDKVGRRYPLVLVQMGAPDDPPTVEADQVFYDDAEAWARGAMSAQPDTPQELLPDAGSGLSEDFAAPESPLFWAVNPKPDVTRLLSDVARVDHQRAALSRSYWWVRGQSAHASTVLACDGMPDDVAMGWLLAGVAADPIENTEQQVGTPAEPDGDEASD